MNLIVEWNNLLLDAIRNVGRLTSADSARGGPPQVARSLAVVYTAVYDAWAAYDDVAKPVHSTTPRRPPQQRTDANRRKAISRAAYRAIIDQFPPTIYPEPFKSDWQARLEVKLNAEGVSPGDTSTNPNTPIGVANLAVDAVLAFRHADKANQSALYAEPPNFYTPLNPPMAVALPASADTIIFPAHWQPLSYLNADHELRTPKFIAPHWGTVKPFALTSGEEFRPRSAPPNELSQSYLDQALHVVNTQSQLTSEQKVIAEYWADGPRSELPPGHWTEFAAFVAERPLLANLPRSGALGLGNSVRLFFALANAIFDASIATWDAKFTFDYVRPVTAIRHLFRGKTIPGWGGPGKGIGPIKGEAWRPFQVASFPTPPFAEFTSGHSGFSMAAATVLKKFTGSDVFGFFYSQDVPLRAEPGEHVTDIVLSWPTFTAAAREAGESRLYGGIHFYEGNVVGLDIGEKVGTAAFTKAEKFWTGV